MYSNYYNYPVNSPKPYQHNYPGNNFKSYQPYDNPYMKSDDDRFIAGGFLGPFLLGGLAGAALSPGWGRPYYNNYYYPYPAYPPYYYRPYPRFYY